jgi:hypothetical protein
MLFILVLVPATMLVMAGYVVTFVANRSEGNQRAFGRYLSFWAFTLAALLVLAALFAAAASGGGRRDRDRFRMRMPPFTMPMPPGAMPQPQLQPAPQVQPAPEPPAE